MPDRVLLTGATGFVGSHVARALAEAGHEVRCGVRPTSDTRPIDDLPAERVPIDLESPRALAEAVSDARVVVHAAGLTRASRPSDYYSVNAEGTRRLAMAAAAAGVRRFVFISSLAARGPDDPSTGAGGDHPVSDYGRSKLAAEAYLRDLDGPMEVVALRPAAVYGPRDTEFLPLFRMARAGWVAVPGGAPLLQPVYAGDLARAVLAASREGVGFGPFPVADGERYAWKDVVLALENALGRPVRAVRLPGAAFLLAGELAGRAARVLGSDAPLDGRRARDLAVHTWTCDVSAARGDLGWRAEVPLFEGLERTARWYLEAGWLGGRAA